MRSGATLPSIVSPLPAGALSEASPRSSQSFPNDYKQNSAAVTMFAEFLATTVTVATAAVGFRAPASSLVLEDCRSSRAAVECTITLTIFDGK